jgi:hypothetical protein
MGVAGGAPHDRHRMLSAGLKWVIDQSMALRASRLSVGEGCHERLSWHKARHSISVRAQTPRQSRLSPTKQTQALFKWAPSG